LKTIDLDNLSLDQNIILNSIAEEFRLNFHLLIDKIGNGKEDSLNWVISNVASRNKYNSPLFIRCCRLLLIKKLINEKNIEKIKTSDYSLTLVIRNYLNKLSIKVECTEIFPQKIKRLITPLYLYVKAILSFCNRVIARDSADKKKLCKMGRLTLLDNFVINSDNGEPGSVYNGKYKDRYYPGMFEYLTDDEKQNLFYLPTAIGFTNYNNAFKKIRTSKNRFILRDDFLKLPDYLTALLHPFRVLGQHVNSIFFFGFNITPILRQEIFYTCGNYNCLEAILYYRFAYRLAKENVKIRMLLEWHENQVIDKGSILGFHHFLPEVPIIGYQGYIISKTLHHYIYPTPSEQRSRVAPDQIAVIGRGLIEDTKVYCNDLDVITAPAFRNQNVWKNRCNEPSKLKFTILIALPLDWSETISILKLVATIPAMINSLPINLWIKPHPTYSPEQITKVIPQSLTAYHIKTGDFSKVIEKSNLLIGNASITSVEALAIGIPVIIIGDRNGVIQNPIPQSVPEDFWKICYTKTDIISAINYFIDELENNALKYNDIGSYIKKNYFEPVSREGVRRLLLLNG